MQVLFLGSGTSHGVPMIGCDCDVCRSPDPHDTRWRPSIYVTCDDGTRLLVDTTPDLRAQALRFGVRQVDAVLYTHSHADHLMGLDEVRRFNAIKKGTMPIFGDAPTLADIRRSFAYIFDPHTPKAGGVPDLQLHQIDGPFTAGGQTVVPVTVMHGRRPILGFRLDRFAYLTDCNAIPDASIALLHGLDTLVLDALRPLPHPTHFTLSEAVEMAGRIGARRTFFTHIAHQMGHAATNASLPARMALAHDGLMLEIPASISKSPSLQI